LHYPGRTEYYFHTVDSKVYRLDLTGAKFYLCGPLMNYVGTGKLVIVKGLLMLDLTLAAKNGNVIGGGDYILHATEVRDPAYPRCK
jgi:hypothetical protein